MDKTGNNQYNGIPDEGVNKIYEQFSRDYESKKKFNSIDDFVFVPERTLNDNIKLEDDDIEHLKKIGKQFIEYIEFDKTFYNKPFSRRGPIIAYYANESDIWDGSKEVQIEPFKYDKIDGICIPKEGALGFRTYIYPNSKNILFEGEDRNKIGDVILHYQASNRIQNLKTLIYPAIK